MFDSLQPHGLQQARIPCVSLYPRDCSNPCPLSQWCVQPSHPRFPPLPLALTLSQHKGLFQWVISLHQIAKVFDLQQQHQSFQWILRVNFLSVSSVQFSHSVMSDSRQPHGLQHTRPTVHHQFLEFTQTHVHWLSDAIQPSHPLSSPSLPAFNLPQHQGLFKWVSSSHQVAKVSESQLPNQSF